MIFNELRIGIAEKARHEQGVRFRTHRLGEFRHNLLRIESVLPVPGNVPLVLVDVQRRDYNPHTLSLNRFTCSHICKILLVLHSAIRDGQIFASVHNEPGTSVVTNHFSGVFHIFFKPPPVVRQFNRRRRATATFFRFGDNTGPHGHGGCVVLDCPVLPETRAGFACDDDYGREHAIFAAIVYVLAVEHPGRHIDESRHHLPSAYAPSLRRHCALLNCKELLLAVRA